MERRKIIRKNIRRIGALFLTFIVLVVTACTAASPSTTAAATTTTSGEVEATEFQGTKLTPIKDQNLNALAGTQIINQADYTLTIDGLVDHPLTLSYADLEALPQVSELATLQCVEGWEYTAEWTGPSLSSIFAEAGFNRGR